MHYKSFNNMLIGFAKLLLFFSVILLVTGIALDIRERQKSTNPIQDILSSLEAEDEKTFISIDNGSRDNYFYDKSAIQNSIDTTALNLDDVNNGLRKELEQRYKISIYYGDETKNYSISSNGRYIKTEPILNSALIYHQLNQLRLALSLYPDKLFTEINDGGIPLTIYLIDHYSDNSITGVTDSNYSYAAISIAAIYPFKESFYHESYHYIERYLLKKGANFNSWNVLNPVGFSYGTVYNNYSYSSTFGEDASFVNNYAQTSAEEDRASTFEYMMADNKARCLNKEKPIWKKASFIALTIETSLNSVNPNTIEYWERYL